jgi:hypothetical protein
LVAARLAGNTLGGNGAPNYTAKKFDRFYAYGRVFATTNRSGRSETGSKRRMGDSILRFSTVSKVRGVTKPAWKIC